MTPRDFGERYTFPLFLGIAVSVSKYFLVCGFFARICWLIRLLLDNNFGCSKRVWGESSGGALLPQVSSGIKARL